METLSTEAIEIAAGESEKQALVAAEIKDYLAHKEEIDAAIAVFLPEEA